MSHRGKIEVSLAVLLSALGLPRDTQICKVMQSELGIVLCVEHPELDDIPEGLSAPYYMPEVTMSGGRILMFRWGKCWPDRKKRIEDDPYCVEAYKVIQP